MPLKKISLFLAFIFIAVSGIACPDSAFAKKGKKLRIKISATSVSNGVKLTVFSKVKKRETAKLVMHRSDGGAFYPFAEVNKPKRKETFTDISAGHGAHWYMAKVISKGRISESKTMEVQVTYSEENPGETIVTTPPEGNDPDPQPDPKPIDTSPKNYTCSVNLPSEASECPSNFADDVLNLVNLERAAIGLNSLSAMRELSCSSRMHTAGMIQSGVMSHDGWIDHIRAAGFTGSSAGQNVAVGYQNPYLVMIAWMNSPGHKANILSPKYTHLGVGCLSFHGGYWWTQDFGGGL